MIWDIAQAILYVAVGVPAGIALVAVVFYGVFIAMTVTVAFGTVAIASAVDAISGWRLRRKVRKVAGA